MPGMVRLAAVALGAVSLWSCKDSTGPSDAELLAATLQQFTNAEGYIPTGVNFGGAPAAGVIAKIPVNCPFFGGSFVCAATTDSTFGARGTLGPFGGSVTVSRTYQFLDAFGQALAAFDSRAVASMHFLANGSGNWTSPATFSQPASATTFSGASDLTLSGIKGGLRSVTGQATITATFTRSGKIKITTMVQTVTKVAPPVAAEQTLTSGGLPLSGSVTSVITGTDTTGLALAPATVVTTFNGTRTVLTQVTQNGIVTNWSCTYPPAEPAVGGVVFIVCISDLSPGGALRSGW